MEHSAQTFLQDLLLAPGVSGYEQPVQQVVRNYAARFADQVSVDLHGNLILCKNPQSPVRLMLAGHADQIGLLVSQVDDSGFIFTQTVGGWDPQQLVGQRMTVWTQTGPISGVIARKAVHLLDENEKMQVVKAKDLWIDIGAANKEEASSLVGIGDSVTFQPGFQLLRNNLANAPGMDNRTGVWVVIEVLRRVSQLNLKCGLFAVSTVQEEVGLRGSKTAAFGIDPQIGIAVDVTHATDCPQMDKRQQGEISLGKGPVIFRGPNINPVVSGRLRELGQKHGIPTQIAALGRAASNDSNSLQITRAGVATGLVSIPN